MKKYLYPAIIVVLILNTLAVETSKVQLKEYIDVLETELKILRGENLVLNQDIELIYGQGYTPGELCKNIIYKTDEGTVYRIGECK